MQKFIRELGSIETRMALFHSTLSGSTQGTQVIRFTGPVSDSCFFAAAKALHAAYVPLQCRIVEEGGRLCFAHDVTFADVPLRRSHLSDLRDLEALVSEAVDTPLEAERALWRMTLVSQVDGDAHALILTAHHAIIDANGMHDLAHNFLRALGALANGEQCPEIPTCGFPQPVDQFLRAGSAPTGGADLTPRKHDAHCPVPFRKTGWQVVELSDVELEALNEQLRRDNVKLHSLTSAALALAMHDAGLVRSPFNFGTAVTLRFLQDMNPEYKNPLGCYMSIASNQMDPAEAELVELARQYDRDLMKTIMTSCLSQVPTELESFKCVVARMAEADAFVQGAGITNMAEVGINLRYHGLRVTDYMMLANRVSANFSIVAHCYEFAGRQMIALVYPRPSLSDATVALVADRLQKGFAKYASFSATRNEPALAD